MGERYNGISLKKTILKEINKRIAGDPNYCNPTDFIRAAIREKLERLDQLERIKKTTSGLD